MYGRTVNVKLKPEMISNTQNEAFLKIQKENHYLINTTRNSKQAEIHEEKRRSFCLQKATALEHQLRFHPSAYDCVF